MKDVLATLALGIATAAIAQRDSNQIAEVNGWAIYDERGVCSASTLYEGDLFVRITYDFGANTAWFLIWNPAWESIEHDRRYNVSLVFSNNEEYPDAGALGIRVDTDETRVTALRMQLLGHEFMDDFANAGGLAVLMGETRLAILSLRGTRAMVQRLSRCAVDGYRRYPPDPFRSLGTSPPTAPATGPSPPQSRSSLASYISDADYPPSALRAGEQGRTSFRLHVGRDGRVTNCVVTVSSGSAALDNATCSIMRRRARFEPARDASGNPAEGTTESSVIWRINDPAPPAEMPE